MSDTTNRATLATATPQIRRQRFEIAWRSWQSGDEPPRWEHFLPAAEQPCSPELIVELLRIDIAFRVKAALPALLAERYFEHPRLRQSDAQLDAAQQVELIRWEYEQRWQNGQAVKRGDYQSAFSQHADALSDLKAHAQCPRCRQVLVLEETWQTLRCPHCEVESPLGEECPPFVTERTPSTDTMRTLDARRYQLIERLGKGGMGEVYRSADPALERDLAIKVMKADLHGHEEYERRFLREARVTGSLQHPNIVAVHNLGRLVDGRLHYTMRLVRGQTFADILQNEAGKPERMPYLLGIFEKICQAVAYAHSKRVIHRDLKPSNVMVGKFGEVQVMDWGLAKVLTSDDDADETTDAAGTHIPTESADTPVDLSRMGSGMGTPAYMPPEQALGEWDAVDERADVFALGSILCALLTTQPAYGGRDDEEMYRRAKRGDVAEALERLANCAADAALTALCRECLCPNREGRPRDAGAIAKRVADYQTEVQGRLRQAELERVAAETRAQEEQARTVVEQARTREALGRVAAERRAKRRTLALAGAVLVLLVVGVVAAWRMQQERVAAQARQDRADREALTVLEQARDQLDEGWRTQNLAQLTAARMEVSRATDIARSGASEAVEQQVAAFRTEVEERMGRAEKNRELLVALVDIVTPQETKTYTEGSGQRMLELVEPSVEEQYAAAFRRRWPDIDVDNQPASAVVDRLQEEPKVVLQGVIAGLDGWMLQRRQQSGEAAWQRLLGVVERLDHSEQRRQLRALWLGSVPPRAEAVAGLLAGRSPWIALVELGNGNNWRRLRQLRGQMNAAAEPVLTVLMLARASGDVGDMTGAETVLRQALVRRPDEVVLLDALGKVLERQGRSRLKEAIGCYRAARVTHRDRGIALSRTLAQAGQREEGEAVLRHLVRQRPNNPEMHFYLGLGLAVQGKYAEAETVYRKAIALKPDYVQAYNNLGGILADRARYKEAEEIYRRVVTLQPGHAGGYYNIGIALADQQKYAKAEAAYQKAIALQPNYAEAYVNLGSILIDQEKPVEAEAACRKAIQFNPNLAEAYVNLGKALKNRRKWEEIEVVCRKAIQLKPALVPAHIGLGLSLGGQGKHEDAEAAYRMAIALKPNYAEAHNNLGHSLNDQGRHAAAEAACRQAIVLKPNLAQAYHNLGNALIGQGKQAEAEAAYRQAIVLKPTLVKVNDNLGNAQNGSTKNGKVEVASRHATALEQLLADGHVQLGKALHRQEKNAAAVAAYRKAIALNSDCVFGYIGLGGVLIHLEEFAQAETISRKAIAVQADSAEAHCNLGGALEGLGRFAESLAAYRRGHELGTKQPEWRYPSLRWVRKAERLIELDKKLPRILAAKIQPANAIECLEYARLCSCKKLYAAAVRLYMETLPTAPKLRGDLNAQHRYNAARCAILAAAGQGKDARSLSEQAAMRFRSRAYTWLSADLTAYFYLAEGNKPQMNKMIQQRLTHWQRDSGLASVREPKALERLPANGRAAWQSLWRDVDALAKRVAK